MNNRTIQLVISILLVIAALAGVLAGVKDEFSSK